jgi:hypothetical protein
VILAAAHPVRVGVPVDLLGAYAEHVATLTISKAGRADRLRAARGSWPAIQTWWPGWVARPHSGWSTCTAPRRGRCCPGASSRAISGPPADVTALVAQLSEAVAATEPPSTT